MHELKNTSVGFHENGRDIVSKNGRDIEVRKIRNVIPNVNILGTYRNYLRVGGSQSGPFFGGSQSGPFFLSDYVFVQCPNI